MAEQRYAVLVGNGLYDESETKLQKLRCPPQDVAALAEMLASETYGPYNVTSLIDASHDRVLEAIYDVLINRAGKDDLVLLYYSGHGKPDQDGNLHLASRNTRTKFLPITSIPLSTIGPWMKQSKSRKIVLILDCCYSGAVERIFSRGETSEQIAQALPKQLTGRGTYVLTASTDVQLAEEKEGDEHGLLTKHILAGIREGAADRDDDGMVSMNELLAYVQEKVTVEGSQTPQGYALQLEGGDLEIAKTGKVARHRRHEELRNAIYSAAKFHSIPFRVINAVCGALEPVPGLSPEAQRRYNDQFDRLYGYRDDSGALVAEMYSIALSVQQESRSPESHHGTTHPQPNQSVGTRTQAKPEEPLAGKSERQGILADFPAPETTSARPQTERQRDAQWWRLSLSGRSARFKVVLGLLSTAIFLMVIYGVTVKYVGPSRARVASINPSNVPADEALSEGNALRDQRKWEQAVPFYQRAAAAGSTEAMTNLGHLYDEGLGVTQNYATARDWYGKAAALGNPDAMFNLGYFYHHGLGVPQDFTTAKTWYEKAAAAGDPHAMRFLGYLYDRGLGVTQNYITAKGWYEKAAAAGDAHAMTLLGLLYERGFGVTQNYTTAKDWYEKAAAAGDADAKDWLRNHSK